jgi:hypothetical protein
MVLVRTVRCTAQCHQGLVSVFPPRLLHLVARLTFILCNALFLCLDKDYTQKLDAITHLYVLCTMTSRQVTRDELRGLYAKKQEEERVRKVREIVNSIYSQVINQASRSADTTFSHHFMSAHLPFMSAHLPGIPSDFYSPNMLDIVAGLQELFPDSTITLRVHNGTMSSTLDPKFISLLDPGQQIQVLVIDWTQSTK